MSETISNEEIEEFGAAPADPFDPDEQPGGVPDALAEHVAADEPDEQPAAEQPVSATKGKRVVLAAPGEWGPYAPLSREPEGTDEPEVALFEGDDRTAKLAALEEFESVAEAAKKGTLVLVSIPASSWKPAAPAPRPRKTDWKL